jgi:hypothetical protein
MTALSDALRIAHSGGALRRRLASLAAQWVRARGWERVGFARVSDHARERLGVSGREIRDLSRVDESLRLLPKLEAALVGGSLAWTKCRLVARVATADDEDAWIGRAKALTAAALAREVRRVDRGAQDLAGAVEALLDAGDEPRDREWLHIRCSPAVRGQWFFVRQLARRVAGRPVSAEECAELVAAEAVSGLGWEGPAPGPVDVADRCTDEGRSRGVARPRRAPAEAEALDPFALEEALRSCLREEMRLRADLGRALRRIEASGAHCDAGYTTAVALAGGMLGVSPRLARELLRIERSIEPFPRVAALYREGRLSWVRASVLLPILSAASDPALVDAWLSHALRVSVRRLRDDVEAALASGDPTAVPDRLEPPRQIGARATDSSGEVETARLMISTTRGVARLLRPALCAARRRLEREGRGPVTDGAAFGWLLDHAAAEWTRGAGHRARSHRVFERDGWRCTAPGCSSQRNLHDHHVVLRSAGGSDDLANRTTLCVWHHLRGVHAGIVRCTGTAPDALRFELGLRPGAGPVAIYRSGDVLGG